MRKFKTLLIAAVFAAFSASAFADGATVTFVSGKVEVQRNGKWIALQKGDTVAKSETVSTGFQSEAKIKILDSVMYLGPVTRITIEELSSSGQKDNVNVYLKTGTARSQVKHVDNKRVNYQVHTAVAVASCRGTGWIIDDSNNVDCYEGMVAVAAYKDPALEDTKIARKGDEAEEEGKDEKEETDEKTEEIADNTTGEKTEDAVAASDDNKPTSDDGVLVQANQSVTVSDTNSVSAPVSTVVKTAAAVTGSVGTAASKESEGGAGVGGGAANAVEASTNGSGNGAGRKETTTVVVVLELPEM